MAVIQWQPKYETGIRKIDRQHRKIVRILNKLFDMQEGEQDLPQLQRIFDDLRSYISEHFAAEEDYLRQHKCEGIDLQKGEHESFIDTVCGFQKELLKQSPVTLINLFNYIWDWFAHHILEVDKKCFTETAV